MQHRDELLFLGPLETWESNILGQVTTFDPGSQWRPYAHLYYCEECGVVWGGRIPLATDVRFMYCERDCRAHGNGSLMSRFDNLDTIPQAVAQYEISVFNPNIYSRFYK